MNNKNKSMVPKNIEDSIMKSITEIFQEDALKFFGMNVKIVSEVNIEITNIEVDKLFLDKLFLLEDGTYVHLEYQSSNNKKDLARFLAYDALAYYKYGNNIKTIVIYSSDITKAETELNAGNINYKISAFYMYTLDGDNKFELLKNKIKKQEHLTREDILTMAFIPLMKSNKDKNKRAIEAVELFKQAETTFVNEHNENREIELCLCLMYALFQKFVDNEYKEKLSEVFEMTVLGSMLIEKGEKRKAIEIAKNMIKKGMDIDTIIEVTGLAKNEIEVLDIELQQN